MTISIIAAIGKNLVIGRNNKLPWSLPADMKRFKDLTLGKPVVMGQKTFESIGKPLSARTNIVLSHDKNFQASGCIVALSIEEALSYLKGFDEIMIIGGSSVYEQFLPLAEKMYLTLIDEEFEGDAYFPRLDWNEWIETERISYKADEKNPYSYSFVNLKRKK